MKRIFLLIGCLGVFFSAQAQLKVGVKAGIPVGDVADAYRLSYGIEGYYMLGDPNAFLKFGITGGYLTYVGDELDVAGQTVEIENIPFLPLAVAGRITLFDVLKFGPDVGYAIGIKEGMDGGFYWKSVLGIDIANRVELDTFYQSISVEGGTIGAIGAGLLLEF